MNPPLSASECHRAATVKLGPDGGHATRLHLLTAHTIHMSLVTRYAANIVTSRADIGLAARFPEASILLTGVADPESVGVGGHSYGAFMTANLLAHSDLFRAGLPRSGALHRCALAARRVRLRLI